MSVGCWSSLRVELSETSRMTRVVDKDEFNPFETMFQKDPETQNNFVYTPKADSQNFEWG